MMQVRVRSNQRPAALALLAAGAGLLLAWAGQHPVGAEFGTSCALGNAVRVTPQFGFRTSAGWNREDGGGSNTPRESDWIRLSRRRWALIRRASSMRRISTCGGGSPPGSHLPFEGSGNVR